MAAKLFRLRKPENGNPLAQALKGHGLVSQASGTQSSEGVSWPTYPGCGEKLMGCESWLCGLSVFRALGNKSAQVHLRRRLQKVAGGELGLEQRMMTHEWDPTSQKWYPLPSPKNPDDYLEWALPVSKLARFIGWALERSRKTREEKLRLFALFDLQLNEKEAEAVKGPVENELLAVLSQCLPFKVEYQHRVGKYRLDAFIPRLRLAIQIDEHGHQGYDAADEKEYDEVIRDNNIVCLRFNPDQKYGGTPPQYELVRQVLERILSPDFATFREKYKLI